MVLPRAIVMVAVLGSGAGDGSVAKPFVLTIERNMTCGDESVNGRLLVDGGEIARTLEPGPAGNRIPTGSHPATIRTDGPLGWRVELGDVPGWKNAQIHLGNYPSNSQGCVLVGTGVRTASDPKTGKLTCAVLGADAALKRIQGALQKTSAGVVSSQQMDITVVVK